MGVISKLSKVIVNSMLPNEDLRWWPEKMNWPHCISMLKQGLYIYIILKSQTALLIYLHSINAHHTYHNS